MRLLLPACWFLLAAPVFGQQPEKKADPPHARLVFPIDARQGPDSWDMTLEMTTASGAVYELPVVLDGNRGNMYCDWTQHALMKANWMSDMESRTLAIYGVRTKQGKADAVKSLVLRNRLVKGKGQFPHLEAVGGVKVETRDAAPKVKPDPANKPRAAGPDLGAETYVEFDFSTLPPGMKDVDWNFTMRVHVEGRKEVYKERFEVVSDFTKDAGTCRLLTDRFNEASYKAELIGNTTIRVYGLTYKDRYYPAVKGEVTSPDLKATELPKVTNPKRF